MKTMPFQTAMLTLAYALAGTANAVAGPGAQGWNGQGRQDGRMPSLRSAR